MLQVHKLLKASVLLLAPVLITVWFVADGGLRNGLNRLGYEMSMGLFFAAHGLFWGVAEGINRLCKKSCPFNLKLLGWSMSLLLIWIALAGLYERLS